MTVASIANYTLPTAASINESEAKDALTFVNKVQLTNQAEVDFAAKALKEIKTKINVATEQKEDILADLKSATAKVNAVFKPAIDSLKEAEKVMKEKVGLFFEDREGVYNELITAAMRKKSAKGQEEGMALAREYEAEIEPPAGVSVRKGWTGTVTDIEAIPRKYLKVDTKALEAYTKAVDGRTDIPGWTPHRKSTVAITVSKIK